MGQGAWPIHLPILCFCADVQGIRDKPFFLSSVALACAGAMIQDAGRGTDPLRTVWKVRGKRTTARG